MQRTDKYKISSVLIGKGSFSKVYKGYGGGCSIVAVKVYDKPMNELFEKEVKIMRTLHHPNIINILGVGEKNTKAIIVMKYYPRGELRDVMRKNQSFITKYFINRFIYQSTSALYYLKQLGIVHRDIKPSNFLIDDDLNFVLCDFGLSTFTYNQTHVTTICGSPIYMAPELILSKPYDYAVDIWSLGVVLYELIHNQYPFPTNSISDLKAFHIKNRGDNIRCDDSHFEFLLNSMLDPNPKTRIQPGQILNYCSKYDLHHLKLMEPNNSLPTTPKPTTLTYNNQVITIQDDYFSHTNSSPVDPLDDDDGFVVIQQQNYSLPTTMYYRPPPPPPTNQITHNSLLQTIFTTK